MCTAVAARLFISWWHLRRLSLHRNQLLAAACITTSAVRHTNTFVLALFSPLLFLFLFLSFLIPDILDIVVAVAAAAVVVVVVIVLDLAVVLARAVPHADSERSHPHARRRRRAAAGGRTPHRVVRGGRRGEQQEARGRPTAAGTRRSNRAVLLGSCVFNSGTVDHVSGYFVGIDGKRLQVVDEASDTSRASGLLETNGQFWLRLVFPLPSTLLRRHGRPL